MTYKIKTSTTLKLIGLLAIVIFIVSSCIPGTDKWKEEVKLSNGRVIVIERELVLESGGDEWASNSSGSKPKEDRLKFTNPDKPGEIIEWHSMKISPQRWPEVPLILDITSNKITVFASVFALGGCNIYTKYIYQNGIWIEEKLPSTFEAHATNLYIFQNEGLSYINLNKKRENISDSGSKHFAQVGPTNPDCSHR
ncbi:hypothetical protein [Methyloradius palustris]|uniref:Lipoprotein n=1 Tax=Methyloradius palustris TaxID=2778876 RepID=A0A8D5G0I0_9PROT|nr:hypothetical protein [Methyloradius palustris]BCM25592.1 hypothetical protein ZMTM_18510 [Methyloradius palustris]